MAKKRKLVPTSTPTSDPVKEEPVDEPRIANDPIDVDPTDKLAENPIKEEPDETPAAAEDPQEIAPSTDPDAPAAADEDDDEERDSDPASVQKLLEPFTKDQLADLLRDAALNHPDVLDEILRLADADPAHRKIFVHGLGWDTTAESLSAAFLPYGEIEDINAVTDKATGKSKGYGFILFKHRSGAQKALKEPQKKIGSRTTSCQLASAGPVPAPVLAPPVSELTQRKIYVSNVGPELDPQKVLQFFAKYGEIEEGPLGLDKVTGKLRGFCLFVYKAAESARKALEEPHKKFEDQTLHCQRAIDGPKPGKMGFQFQQGGASSSILHQAQAAKAQPAGHGFPQSVQPPASAAAMAGLNPVLGQALSALLANQGTGLGLTNILNALGSAGVGGQVVNQGVPSPLVNPDGIGGYGAMQGGYGNTQMGPGGTGRTQQGRHFGGMPRYFSR